MDCYWVGDLGLGAWGVNPQTHCRTPGPNQTRCSEPLVKNWRASAQRSRQDIGFRVNGLWGL